MRFSKKIFNISTIFCILAATWLAACSTSQTISTPIMATEKPMPTATLTPLPTQTKIPTLTPTPDIWAIQKCRATSSIIDDHMFIWNYTGDIEKQGQLDMLLNFTENNEIQGFAFDFGQMDEYQVNGCVQERNLIMWLQQGDTVEAIIRGEFPSTDSRGTYSPSSVLSFDVITGWLTKRDSSASLSIYLHLSSGTAGTMKHRFELAGVNDDAIILNASKRFLTAVANDDRGQVVDMINFPIEIWFKGEHRQLQTPEMFLAYYNSIFGDGFKERLAHTFPNYLMADAGNFVGIIGQSIYGGGGISFDEHGKVVGVYNWKDEPTPTPTTN